MRVLLEQIDTIDINDLLRKATVLANKERVIEADVIEDKNRVYRFGTVSVRWSYLSEKWILQDGVVIEGTYDTAKAAIQRAKEVSGYEKETKAQIIHTEPLPMKFDGAIPLDVVQSFQPTPLSIPSGGGFGGGGVAPTSFSMSSPDIPEIPGDSSLGDMSPSAIGGPDSLDMAFPDSAASNLGDLGSDSPSASDLGA